ncbi:MAG TPA: ABC transporter permease [Thermoanaerobaculia bacterium]|nr:ABC transporter permease [Thermoanaerobaculia bacterium]
MKIRDLALRTGDMALLSGRAFAAMATRPLEITLWFAQMDQLGVRSLAVAGVATTFTGMVLALQTAYSLPSLGVKYYIGSVVAKSLVRELGPVLTALIVGGRIGAGMTAEIGSMRVTEQIDAMRSMAVDPVKKLVAPKLGAVLVMLPALTVIGCGLGILGGLLVAVFQLNVQASVYLNNIVQYLTLADIVSGVGKSFVFAFIITIIGCYNGLHTTGGADGVGRATTDTVVTLAITVMISDYFLTRLFILFVS